MGDFLFAITDWLRTTALLDFSFWIADSSVSLFMVENFWVLPIVQVIHILGIGAAFGAALMLMLRVTGRAGAGLTIDQTAARFVPWIKWGIVIITISGLGMLAAEPLRNLINAVFWFKMVFLFVMIALTLSFLKSVRAQAATGGASWQASGGTATTAWVILILWCLIMVCGRWIAYVPV